MPSVTDEEEIKNHKSPQWCTIFKGENGCFHVDWGHQNGAPLSYETVKRLSNKYIEEHRRSINAIWFIIASDYSRRFFDGPWVNFDDVTKNRRIATNHGTTKRRKKTETQSEA